MNEIIIKAFLVYSEENIEEFNIKVDETKAPIIKARLGHEYQKIILLLKIMKDQGIIKSIWIPKNRKIQATLDKLVTTKRQIRNSITKIKTVYN
jgi:hypothetical protein